MSSDSPASRRPGRLTIIAASAVALGMLGVAGVVYAVIAHTGIPFIALHLGIATFAVFLLIANTALLPLAAITESARRVAQGDFDVRVDTRGGGGVGQLADAFNGMTESLRERTDSLTKRVSELSTLYDMSYALSSTLDLDALLGSVLDAALRIFGVDTGYVMLRDRATGAYSLRAWRGSGEAPDERALRSSMSEWVIHQGRPLVFNPPQNGASSDAVDSVTGASAAVCVPLVTSDGTVGALAVGGREAEFRFSSQDVRLLTTIANHLTIAIGNTELFSSLQDAYLATVRSLAAAVDAKDPYTRGHSDSVALFARAAAEHMGLSHEQCTALEMAAYLHDIGKIGISEGILRKPGRLDDEETGTMRHHPLIGANILRPVAFPWPIAPVVRHHHEHFDGTGYPSGLKGEEIPLLARILAAADAYEAMTADRPYRLSRTPEAAIAELRRCAGTDFDPRVVDAMIEALADMDQGGATSQTVEADVEPSEAHAVFVAIVDGMFAAFRRLGGPRLAGNLESALGEWLEREAPAFSMHAGHVAVSWDLAGDPPAQFAAMRNVVGEMASLMSAATGRSLVDGFYADAISGLSERLRRVARDLALYGAG
jgi:putative nucleotidyltransferase with HDIG domain